MRLKCLRAGSQGTWTRDESSWEDEVFAVGKYRRRWWVTGVVRGRTGRLE